MPSRFVACAFLLALASNALALPSSAVAARQSGRQSVAQKNAPEPPSEPLLKRTTTKHEVRRMGYGGSLTIYGAPVGSITVEAWDKSEVEINADIEQSAATEEDLARLSALNGFTLDSDVNRLQVTTVGVHDRKYLKRVARDLPKNLLAMPWKIDYRLRVPSSCDLEIYSGQGALNVSGVEGALRLNAGDGGAGLTLAGGDVEATLRSGPVSVRVPARSWRGRGMSVRLASGDLTVELPAGFNGDVDAEVLRTGRVENAYAGLAPREDTKATERSLQGRAGAGGATLSFTVGDGTLRIRQASGGQ
ncbi:MAG TPA: hypothetical protein VLJ61_17445 [Pyrinomonadaceae bacterium]|nr:hypothetical protein [Pyrinomonadaceae bacterium]